MAESGLRISAKIWQEYNSIVGFNYVVAAAYVL